MVVHWTEKFAAGWLTVPVTGISVTVQVNNAGVATAITGGLVSLNTSMESVEVQPFTGSVAVVEYMPGRSMVGFAVFPPVTILPFGVDQIKAPPGTGV